MQLKTFVKKLVRKHLNEEVRRHLDMHLPDDLKYLADLFKQEGHKLYVVGGSVRDALLGKEPKDYDVATDAVPQEVTKILETDPQLKVLQIGAAFGVVKVITPEGNEYEIATFRRDLSKGRRPDAVEFSDISTDVLRRDLTINALFYDIDEGEVVDYVGGIDDIENNVVKAVGEPKERFDEDRLRILRALRFAARMGSALDPATSAAIKNDNKLTGVSPERIRDEFLKGIKSAKTTDSMLGLVDEYDMWSQIFPGLDVSSWKVTSKNVPVILALLLNNNDPQVVAKRLNALKYSAEEVSQVKFLLEFKKIKPETAFKLKKLFLVSHLTDEDLTEYVTELSPYRSRLQHVLKAFIRYNPSINGNDLIAQGFSGAALGKEMERRETEIFKEML